MKVALVSLLIAFSVVLAQEPAAPVDAGADPAVGPEAPETLPGEAPAPAETPQADEHPVAAPASAEAQTEAEALAIVGTNGMASLKGIISLVVLPLGACILSVMGY